MTAHVIRTNLTDSQHPIQLSGPPQHSKYAGFYWAP